MSSAPFFFGKWPIRASEIFFESAHSVGLVNLKPVVPGHVLVLSRRCVPRFADLTEDEVSDLWISVQKVSKVLQKAYNASSLTIAIQDGPEAGQTVPHVHVHVLPRRPADFEKNDQVYDKIEDASKEMSKALDSERRDRTQEEMATEAAMLRTYFC
mmetsp:Transcript_15180/g.26019  ORF Transcript_15180/g.26019 Transcript_15180/m.26019 type:complete len:156 (+) Transcript_15180:20-487(+)